jgi:hypothetical protein
VENSGFRQAMGFHFFQQNNKNSPLKKLKLIARPRTGTLRVYPVKSLKIPPATTQFYNLVPLPLSKTSLSYFAVKK